MPEYFEIGDKPTYLLGTNWWPGNRAHRMWIDWDPGRYAAELDQMAGLGLKVYRVFLQTAEFTPYAGHVNPTMLDRLGELLDMSHQRGLLVMPTFFVGPASGIMWDFMWRQGRDFYSDPEVLAAEVAYVQAVVRRFVDHPGLFGWILTNEIPAWSGSISPNKAAAWTAVMYQAIRAIDQKHVVGTGDGARSEAKRNYDGFRAEHILPFVDYFGNHLYNYYEYELGDNDPLRWSYAYSCRVKYNSGLGKPVFQEEFGTCSDLDSEEHQADFYRVLLFSTLINGTCGAMPWGLSDFVMEDWVPYSYRSSELHYGVIRADGSEKPAAAEMRRFAKFVATLDLTRFRLEPAGAALLIPSSTYVDYPYSPVEPRLQDYRLLQTAFTLAKSAGFDIDFVREQPEPTFFQPSRLPDEAYDLAPYRLVVVPNVSILLTSGWRRLYDFAAAGGTVYLSYSGAHGGVSCPIFEQFFGVKHQLRYGITEVPKTSTLSMRFRQPFHGIEEGEEILFPVSGTPPATAYCPVSPTTAQVIAVDQEGRPSLLVNPIGRGQVVFSSYPLEYYTFKTPEGNSTTSANRLYRALARLAGIEPTCGCDNRFLELGQFVSREGGESILVTINHAWTPQTVEIAVSGALVDWETGEPVSSPRLELQPRQVVVLGVRERA